MVCYWHGEAAGARRRRACPRRPALRDCLVGAIRAEGERLRGPVSVRILATVDPGVDSQSIIRPCLAALERSGAIDGPAQIRRIALHREDRGENEPDWISLLVTALEERRG